MKILVSMEQSFNGCFFLSLFKLYVRYMKIIDITT